MAAVFLAGVTFTAAGDGDSPWRVPEAPLCFELQLGDRPTQASAGYVADFPDGGLLPGPAPVTHVFDEDGNALDSYGLWHNPETFLGFVFADPGARAARVSVYVTGEKAYRLWHPGSGLTPGPALISEPGEGVMSRALELGRFGRVGRAARFFWNYSAHKKAPLTVAADPLARPPPGVRYLLAYLVTHDPGNTWVAPISQSGLNEVRLSGALITPRPRVDKWGGSGQWVQVPKGPQRLDIFQAAPGSEPGIVFLTWRTPKATLEELGGVREAGTPMAGTSERETRAIEPDEVVQSGRATLAGVRTRDGAPAAVIRPIPRLVFWTGQNRPLFLYDLSAVQTGNPPDTVYQWRFEDGGAAEGATIPWLLPDFREHRITLTAKAKTGQSKAQYPLFNYFQAKSSFNKPEHRSGYRSAIHAMLLACTNAPEAVAAWDPATWRYLLDSLEFGGQYELLSDLFRYHAPALRQRLSVLQVDALQEMLLEGAAGADPRAALDWVRTFKEETRVESRRQELILREAEFLAHYLNDRAGARARLEPLARDTGPIGQRARVRLGDLALMDGDLNLATRYYADVQHLARHGRGLFPGLFEALSAGIAEGQKAARPSPVTAADLLRADRDRFVTGAAQQREQFLKAARGGLNSGAPTEKLGALLEASASENVRQLIQEGHLLEARQALDSWERDFPLSKISGDHILLESQFYLAAGNPQRAYGLLRAYCDLVDASSYLPDAAKLLVDCMTGLNRPAAEIRTYAHGLRNRLEFHPVARELDLILQELP